MDDSDRDVEMSCRQSEMSRVDVATSDDKTMQESSSLGSGLLSNRSEAPRSGRSRTPSITASLSRRSLPQGADATVSSTADTANWWGKLLWGKTTSEDADEDDTTTKYQSLEPPESEGSQTARINGYSLSTGALTTSSTEDRSSSSTTTTIEDRLKQNCSFFYQGMDDHSGSSSRNQRRLQYRPEGTRFVSLTSSLNQSMPRFMSSLEASRFRTRYEKLNNAIVSADNDDLIFDEYQGRQGRQNSTVNNVVDFSNTATASQNTGKLSTLFFEQNGRLLMKLPRDQIRLIMDQDLEPGIISVEQWRKVDRNHFDPMETAEDVQDARMAILEDDAAVVNNTSQLPPLRYVMTVPDDLYRRVVAEMSYALLPPCWGFFNCCNATDGKADIKIALVILAVILLFMFISTMVWPTN